MKLADYLNRLFTRGGPTDSPQREKYLKEIAETVGRDWVSGPYYEQAEDDSWVRFFWDPGSLFRRMFGQLNTSVVVELACGHGRHSAQMRDWDNRKILMDINQSNIDHCMARFSGDPRYTVFLNNGYDCRPLGDMSCTALFCYDAMVHFDSEIVFSYLRDSLRVLTPGGRALLHHSNYTGNPGGDYRENPHFRNYMSQSLFVHYSRKAGFTVLESVTMKWGDEHPDLDCLTLIAKPG